MEWDDNKAQKIAEGKAKVRRIYEKVVILPYFLDEALLGIDSLTGAYIYDRGKVSRLIGARYDLSEEETELQLRSGINYYKDYFKKPIFMNNVSRTVKRTYEEDIKND